MSSSLSWSRGRPQNFPLMTDCTGIHNFSMIILLLLDLINMTSSDWLAFTQKNFARPGPILFGALVPNCPFQTLHHGCHTEGKLLDEKSMTWISVASAHLVQNLITLPFASQFMMAGCTFALTAYYTIVLDITATQCLRSVKVGDVCRASRYCCLTLDSECW